MLSKGQTAEALATLPKSVRDFIPDFSISGKISRFHAGFRDFNGDFGISSKISGFQLKIWDFNEDFEISTKISGFQAAGNDQ